jgi:hypothetical protein
VVWKFLGSLVGVVREAIQSGDETVRLALLLGLLIILIWVLVNGSR